MSNNGNREIVKKIVKKAIMAAAKPILVAALIIAIVSAFVASILHFITVLDGTTQEDDWSNVPYASDQYSSNITIDSDGNITTAMSAQELWDKLLENDSRVNKYLDKPEELQKLLNAELVTDFLDTRPNPDDPIDWDSINGDPNSKKIQGIIKLKRATSDGNTITMVYTDPETFQSNIDQYNETGSEADKKVALSYFTLERGYTASNFGTGAKITAGTTINIPSGLGAVHTYMGWQCITSTTSKQYELREKAGMNFDEEGFGRINGRYVIACTTTFGAVGDYVDFYQEDGSVIQCIIGDIKNQNDAGCNEWGHLNGTCIIEFVVNKDTWYSAGNGGQAASMHVNPGQQGFHMEWNQNLIKAVNGGSYFDNPNFGSESISGNGTEIGGSSSGTMKWPTDGTTITSWFGPRNDPMGSGGTENHGAIDIAVPTGTNVYAAESGTVTMAGNYGTAGNMVAIDHGNGYVTKYMHNSELKVSAGDKVEKGQVIALSGSTGRSTGPHLHFQVEYNGVKIDPLTFKYDNEMGDGVGGIGSNPSGTSTGTKYYAKIATWSETTDTVTSDDPEVEQYSTTRYNMTSTRVNYQDLVSGYTMPFEYLWDFLLIGQEKEFVLELADLVYGSEIEITVHDNLTVDTNINTDTYTRKTKVITDDVKVAYSATSETYDSWDKEHQYPHEATVRGTKIGGPFEGEKSANYTTVHTVITKNNTLDISLTKANVWMLEYTKDYAYQMPNPTNTVNDMKQDDVPYTDTPAKTDHVDAMGLAEKYRQEVQSSYEESYSNVSTTVTDLTSQYYYSTINRNININDTVETTKYVSSPADIREKTDPNSDEANFVTIYIKKEHYKNASNVNSATAWLFEILGKNESTKDLVDLTKYLLYKATGKDYGVTEFDFSIFQFKPVSSITGSIGWNWTCAHENYALWAYCHEKTGNYSQYYVKNYVTADKSLYYMQGDSTSNDSRNYGYGVCIYVKGQYMEHTFPNYGIDITDAQYQNFGTSTLPVEIVDNVSKDIWMANREDVIKTIQSLGYNENDFESYQIDCLTDIRYQGWSIKNLITTYMQKGLCDDVYYSCKGFYAPVPGSSQKHSRGEDRWLLFSQGRYVISDSNGAVLDEFSASDFSGSGNFSVDTVTAGGYTYPHYLQKDYPGAYGTSTIPRSGCGPTSLAMILAGLKGDETITPITVVENINAYWPSGKYYVPGVGSSHCIFSNAFVQKYYGVSSEYGISQATALSALEQGYPVIGGETGHILAIIPAPDEYKNQGYKFYIMDSGRGHDGPYKSVADANRVVEGSLNFLAIIKP